MSWAARDEAEGVQANWVTEEVVSTARTARAPVRGNACPRENVTDRGKVLVTGEKHTFSGSFRQGVDDVRTLVYSIDREMFCPAPFPEGRGM